MDIDAVEAALVLLRQASVLMRTLDAHFARFETSQLRFLILIVLEREPRKDALTMAEVADRLDVSRPVLTRTIKSLAEAGMLRSKSHHQDGRAKQLTITKQGSRFLAELLPGYYQIIEEFARDDAVHRS